MNTTSNDYVVDSIQKNAFEKSLEGYETVADFLEAKGLITYVKNGKSKPCFRIRLSKYGREVLASTNEKQLHELTELTFNYTKECYIKIGAESRVKNGNKVKFYISEWLYFKENYTEKMMKSVILAYISQFEHDIKYMHGMLNLFFKSSNAYATKWTCEDSPICQFIDKNKELIKSIYRSL